MAGSTTTTPEPLPGHVQAGPGFPVPFLSRPSAVRAEWIDHNGHLNLAYYVVLFDEATDALWEAIGVGEGYRARTGCGTFAVETHTLYMAELLLGDATTAQSLVLGADGKRLHVAHELTRDHDGAVAARQELMFLNVDLSVRRAAPWPTEISAGLEAVRRAHAVAERPGWVGRRVGMPVARG